MNCLCCNRDTKEVDESDVFVTENLHLVNEGNLTGNWGWLSHIFFEYIWPCFISGMRGVCMSQSACGKVSGFRMGQCTLGGGQFIQTLSTRVAPTSTPFTDSCSTPLSLASGEGHLEILLENGADHNFRHWNETTLYRAWTSGRSEVAELLLKMVRADINASGWRCYIWRRGEGSEGCKTAVRARRQ